ncbi:hypothetical protein PPL_11487 [Heterostelium album PN500]|uniref:Uncharacterized protein n=1 Tax=Heterostelium pallidum (strain ATCC 26659 / Pp 5 / PN500) TaxID=670386 RepID=D3BTJ1_HETP5|nr:hypothetical protein PPL_11487 [Heterostelium album PN500]EFA75408.1 hypothetical protein PPL_11487 [Heterostelium album PN500]|eukprot:XP_020427542.1 hypothetical protein PPL_11487 [Heterostelium album PN500]
MNNSIIGDIKRYLSECEVIVNTNNRYINSQKMYYETKLEQLNKRLEEEYQKRIEFETMLRDYQMKELEKEYRDEIITVLIENHSNISKERDRLVESFNKERKEWNLEREKLYMQFKDLNSKGNNNNQSSNSSESK